jgi:hypothetical protein
MIKIKFHNFLIIFGFLLWFVETAYFGFNLTPINKVEKFLDNFSWGMILSGVILSIFEFYSRKVPIKIEIKFDKNFIEAIKNFEVEND